MVNPHTHSPADVIQTVSDACFTVEIDGLGLLRERLTPECGPGPWLDAVNHTLLRHENLPQQKFPPSPETFRNEIPQTGFGEKDLAQLRLHVLLVPHLRARGAARALIIHNLDNRAEDSHLDSHLHWFASKKVQYFIPALD